MSNSSELILGSDGSAYHLGLLPAQVAPLVITVGDPDRVEAVSSRFDEVTSRIAQREFVTHVGRLAERDVMCISTGIGTDNVDIVVNELDALVNVDLLTGEALPSSRQLTFLRLGTSGALQPDLAIDSLLVSGWAVGLDGLGPHYCFAEADIAEALCQDFPVWAGGAYGARAHRELVRAWSQVGASTGNTLTCAGFYGPQRRRVRLPFAGPSLGELTNWRTGERRLDNLEMETAGIYGLAELLGHRAVSVSVLLANRATGQFSERPAAAVEGLLDTARAVLIASPQLWWGA